MALRTDSYSAVAGIVPFAREYLDGATTFNSTTTPTVTEVEGIIDEISGVLNVSLRKAGFAPSDITANSTAKLSCDSWTRGISVQYVEIMHAGVGFGGAEDGRVGFLDNIYQTADDFVQQAMLGFKREGISVSNQMHEGLAFTATTKRANRADPDNSSLEQPKIRRGIFDNIRIGDDGTL